MRGVCRRKCSYGWDRTIIDPAEAARTDRDGVFDQLTKIATLPDPVDTGQVVAAPDQISPKRPILATQFFRSSSFSRYPEDPASCHRRVCLDR